jgi:MFS family permease
MKSFIPLVRAEWRLLLFGFVMTFGSSLGQTYFIGLFGGDIRSDLQLSHGAFGAIYSAATLASAILLLWTGSLIDRLELKHYAYMVVFGLCIGCLMIAGSVGTVTLFLSVLVLRHLGQGLMGMAGPTTLVRYIDQQKGKANALGGIGYSLSEAILPSIVVAQLALMSWRQSWVAWAIILGVTVPLATRALLRGHEVRHALYLENVSAGQAELATAKQRNWTRDEVVRDPLFYLFMPALLAQPMLFTGFMFHQVHLTEVKGWSLPVWGGLYVLYAVVSTFFKLWAGLLVDNYGAIRLAPLVCLPLGLGLLFLGSSSSLLVAILFMVLLAVSVGAYSTLSSPFFAEMYGTLHLGSIKSVTTAAMVFASAIAPVLMGLLIDRGVSMDTMAYGSVAYVLIASAMAWRARSLKYKQR